MAKAGNAQAATEAWAKFKELRNKVNNRKKSEEINFKSEKLSVSKDSPSKTWSTVKVFMHWKKSGGPHLIFGEAGFHETSQSPYEVRTSSHLP